MLLEKARDFERSVGRRDDLRRIFAFQDEQFPDIGEWSTDRRRQLRNQVGRRSEDRNYSATIVDAGANGTVTMYNYNIYIYMLYQ